MTEQDNIEKRIMGNMKQKTLFRYVTVTAFLISLIGAITFVDQQIISGQTMMGNSTVSTSLSESITIAERSVGNNSYAIGAFGEDRGGSLVYRIILGTLGTEFYDVTVDSDNGNVLRTQELSQKELEDEHLEHSQKMLSQPKLNNTFNTFMH
jgi:hypothetical protein